MAPRVGFEPTTLRLTAECSTVELPRNLYVAQIIEPALLKVKLPAKQREAPAGTPFGSYDYTLTFNLSIFLYNPLREIPRTFAVADRFPLFAIKARVIHSFSALAT